LNKRGAFEFVFKMLREAAFFTSFGKNSRHTHFDKIQLHT